MNPMTPERASLLGRKVRAFLRDEDVRGIFERLGQDAYEQFKTADTETKRLEAWAYSHAVEELMAALQGAVEAGDLADSEKE